MLIKRVYESGPLTCPRFGSEMAVVAFNAPLQGEVSEKSLRHCCLWRGSAPSPLLDVAGVVHELAGRFSGSQPEELTFVDIDTFEGTF